MAQRISQAYQAALRAKHQQDPDWGTSAKSHADWISAVARAYGADSILDYGCGKGALADHIRVRPGVTLQQYDPGIEGFDTEPDPADMVVCLDVLEHIEPDCVDAVIQHLATLTNTVFAGTIAYGPAIATLPDGSNAHLVQERSGFWIPRIAKHLEIELWQRHGGFYQIIAIPLHDD